MLDKDVRSDMNDTTSPSWIIVLICPVIWLLFRSANTLACIRASGTATGSMGAVQRARMWCDEMTPGTVFFLISQVMCDCRLFFFLF